jgi:hypothetical protein
MLPPSELLIASGLIYPPRPVGDASRLAKRFMLDSIKVDKRVSGPNSLPAIEYAVRCIVERIRKLNDPRFGFLLSSELTLVPMPGHALRRQDALWVPKRIAEVLVDNGVGVRVATLIHRATAVVKSAIAPPERRADAQMHFESMGYTPQLGVSGNVLFVDDVVTRGSTLLGAARRICESAGNGVVPIGAFALARTADLELKDSAEMLHPDVERIVSHGRGSSRTTHRP